MALKQPESMDECIYFTKRSDGGKITCWVLKEKCPECKKGIMGKPKNPKTGEVKIRATEYVCPECGYRVGKKEYEETLTANVEYTCPKCKYESEIQIPFKRKKVKGTDALVFQCGNCKEKIVITKKMKKIGEKA